MNLDPRTPVVVGVGQASERLGEPGYQRRSPVDLAADAARAAIDDSGADPAAVNGRDRHGGRGAAVRELRARARGRCSADRTTTPARWPGDSGPTRPARCSRSVAARRRSTWSTSSVRSSPAVAPRWCCCSARRPSPPSSTTPAPTTGPDFTEHAEGTLEDRGYGLRGIASATAPRTDWRAGRSQYALLENARRARLKQTREEYAAAMGALFAPFTRVAAANPHAAAPVERSAAELVTPTGANRPIADPYTRYLVAREKVNQGAAVLLMSVAAAQRLGVPADRLGVPARSCRPAGTGPDGPGGAVREPGRGAGCQSRAGDGRHPRRRPGHHRPVQLLPGAGVQHLRRAWPRSGRPARSHADRRPAVLRRRGQQLLHARHRRDRAAGRERARIVRLRRGQRRRDEQVLGRGVLHHPGRVDPGPQRRAAGRDRRPGRRRPRRGRPTAGRPSRPTP